MSKVYCVFYSKNGHIVWGQGGKSGNPGQERTGYHLPGGTMHKDKKKIATIGQIQKTIKKELAEELGPTLGGTIIKALKHGGEGILTQQELDGHKVYICFFEIKDLLFPPGLPISVTDGDNSNPCDEAYKNLIFEHFDRVQVAPSWFLYALELFKGNHASVLRTPITWPK